MEEGVWSREERVISIVVLPPWYRSWWAWLLYAGMATGMIGIYIRYKNKQSQLAYEVKLAHLNAERESEINRRKLDFFTNIAHEFRTPRYVDHQSDQGFFIQAGCRTGTCGNENGVPQQQAPA